MGQKKASLYFDVQLFVMYSFKRMEVDLVAIFQKLNF